MKAILRTAPAKTESKSSHFFCLTASSSRYSRLRVGDSTTWSQRSVRLLLLLDAAQTSVYMVWIHCRSPAAVGSWSRTKSLTVALRRFRSSSSDELERSGSRVAAAAAALAGAKPAFWASWLNS